MFRRKPAQPTLPPEWMIVGLGNPGPEYARTRHNVGFDVIDELASRYRIKLMTRKHRAVYGLGEIKGHLVVLVKPMTFMNLSGQAIGPVRREFNLPVENILVIADDLDMELARTRLKPKGGSGGHNGHKSLIGSLGSDNYPRLKIGIGRSDSGVIDHVLDRFSPIERSDIEEAIERSIRGIEELLERGLESAISLVNSGS